MLRKTDSNNPADWLYLSESELAGIQQLCEVEIGYEMCRSKLAEVIEKLMKAELIRLGWHLERTHDLGNDRANCWQFTHRMLVKVMSIDPIRLEFPLLHDPSRPIHRIAGRLEPYLRVIVCQFQPLKIILFGSHAYGNPSDDSDLDLLIVRQGLSTEKESNIEIRQALWQVPGARPGFTLLTKSPEYLEERRKRQSPFYLEILGRGLEVYAA